MAVEDRARRSEVLGPMLRAAVLRRFWHTVAGGPSGRRWRGG